MAAVGPQRVLRQLECSRTTRPPQQLNSPLPSPSLPNVTVPPPRSCSSTTRVSCVHVETQGSAASVRSPCKQRWLCAQPHTLTLHPISRQQSFNTHTEVLCDTAYIRRSNGSGSSQHNHNRARTDGRRTLPVAPVALTPARMPSEQGTMKTALDTLRLRVTNPRPRLQSIRASRSQQQQRQDPFNPSISRQQSHPRQHDSVRAAQEFATAMEYTAVLLQSGQLDLESPLFPTHGAHLHAMQE